MIIKHRGNSEPKKFETTCRKCNSVLEATEDELKWEHMPRNETLAREQCPVCQTDIFFYP